MPKPATLPVHPRRIRCGRLVAGAALLILALAASPSGADDCDGYIGGPDESAAFWSSVSQNDLRLHRGAWHRRQGR